MIISTPAPEPASDLPVPGMPQVFKGSGVRGTSATEHRGIVTGGEDAG